MATPSPPPIRVLLVDDHTLLRSMLAMYLSAQPAFTVVGEAATAAEALRLAGESQPEVIVLDLDLNGESSLDLIPRLLAVVPQTRVLILTGLRDPVVHEAALCRGAVGLVCKTEAAEVLPRAIMKVHAGEVWIERTMMAQVLGTVARQSTAPPLAPESSKIATLTPRERDIIGLIGQGLKNREIATRLKISETTVRHHLTAIFGKLGVTDRLELLVYLHRHYLVDPA